MVKLRNILYKPVEAPASTFPAAETLSSHRMGIIDISTDLAMQAAAAAERTAAVTKPVEFMVSRTFTQEPAATATLEEVRPVVAAQPTLPTQELTAETIDQQHDLAQARFAAQQALDSFQPNEEAAL